MAWKERYEQRILRKYGDTITGLVDLTGNASPSFLFYYMAERLACLLSGDPLRTLSPRTVSLRKRLNPLLKRMGRLFLGHTQVFENRRLLQGADGLDEPITLPKEPVIWCANHGFKEDVLATVLSSRHAYILFGSLPIFYNTFDGVSAFLNGVVMCNRKIAASRHASFENCKRVLRMGTDLLLFPEGVWNKTPEKLLLDFWPGVYRIAKETGSKVVPVIHYISDPHKKGDVIHTVIADPISMDGLTEQEGLKLLRDTMATWYYLMMERYGRTTRQELLGNKSADEAWENYLSMHTGKIKYYDREIEVSVDYRLRNTTRPSDVWRPIAELESGYSAIYDHICFARHIIAQETRRDFQHRF